MTDFGKVQDIRKLANKFGTPLVDAEFIGEGVTFYYNVKGTTHSHSYSNADRGLEEEVIRLERLLAIEI